MISFDVAGGSDCEDFMANHIADQFNSEPLEDQDCWKWMVTVSGSTATCYDKDIANLLSVYENLFDVVFFDTKSLRNYCLKVGYHPTEVRLYRVVIECEFHKAVK